MGTHVTWMVSMFLIKIDFIYKNINLITKPILTIHVTNAKKQNAPKKAEGVILQETATSPPISFLIFWLMDSSCRTTTSGQPGTDCLKGRAEPHKRLEKLP